MTQYLRTGGTDERVTLSGYGELPGVVTNIEVTGQYEIEKKKMEGRSGSVKLGRGYNDAQVAITLEILPPNEFQQVKQIEAAFKNAFGAAGKPKPIRITNPLLDSRDVVSVLFQGFTTTQGNEDDSLLCTLNFIEFEPHPSVNRGAGKEKVVSGPRGLPTGQTPGSGGAPTAAPVRPEAAGYGDGSALAIAVGGVPARLFGLPSNAPPPPTPPYAADLVNGGPMAQQFIGGPPK